MLLALTSLVMLMSVRVLHLTLILAEICRLSCLFTSMRFKSFGKDKDIKIVLIDHVPNIVTHKYHAYFLISASRELLTNPV